MSQCKQIGLFGEPLTETRPRKQRVPAGHADVPGHGPPGETCGSCDYFARILGYGRRYHKCVLIKSQWTCGYGTDVRRKDPACRLWVERKDYGQASAV